MSDGPTLPPPGTPVLPGDPTPDEPAKAWWKKWWVIAIAVLFVLVILGGIFGSEDDSDTAETASASTSEPVATDAPEVTDGPSTTEAATTTEAPPTTPAPTAPPTTPAPTTPAPPFVIQGTGDSVQEITIPDGGQTGIATITHDGSGNFAVWALDSGLQQVDLLVNEIGSYQGTVLLPADGATALEITAGGNWIVEVKQVASAQTWDGTISGRGDNVVIYLGDTGVAEITHNGESNFSVFSYPISDDGFADLLINEIGPYSGSVRFPGPALIEISADGDWSITLS